ncbi:hypothetical protein [Nocardioides sp. SYSU D00038]|uniref:hypothetical protein n=1 Tax=Nocardioides sp. SYSU D00038 TaxID=2812554 RepID=UPI0019672774|nr:hypothetical protein [Nocardioides sp. SYSU D00038]
MKHPILARLGIGTASAALTLGVLSAVAAAPAHADPVITDGELDTYATAYKQGGASCTQTAPDVDIDKNFSASDNQTLTNGHSYTGAVVNDNDASDRTDVVSQQSGSIKVATAGGSFASADFRTNGRFSLTAAKGAAQACNTYAYAYIETEFEFKIAQAGWFTVDMASKGYNYVEAYIEVENQPGPDTDQDHYSEFENHTGTDRVWLPAGEYRFYAETYRNQYAVHGNVSKTMTARITASFVPGGAAPAAAQGGGKAFVDLPAARDCAANAVTATFKKPAKKVAKATFYVNGKKRKTVNSAKKGKTVKLGSLVDAKPVTVKAVLKLDPPRKGKKGKTKTVTRSYTACSG